MKLKNLVKKGGIADIVTLMIIIGIVIALIIAVVMPMVKQTTDRQDDANKQAGAIDNYNQSMVDGAVTIDTDGKMTVK